MGACLCSRNTHILPCLIIIRTLMFLFLLVIPVSAAPLTFSYPQFLQNDDKTLSFEGDVYQDNGVLQLTKLQTESAGRVTYYKQLHLWEKQSRKLADFNTHFTFIINIAPNKTHHADGITFFLAKPSFSLPIPPDGRGIGLVGRRELSDSNYLEEHPFVAVEFDTFHNDLDPPYDHVGIDIKNMWTSFTTQWFTVKDGRKYDAEISYNSGSSNLSVIFTGYKDNITVKQDYSHVIDLRQYLPEWVEFGFSSATGSSYEIHTLCSWSFNSSSLDLEVQKDKSNKRLGIWLSVGAGVVAGVLGITWFVIWKTRRGRHGSDVDLTMDTDFERGSGPKKFSYDELVRATNSFAEEQKLGEGGFGGVYKGFIRESNMYVAIKKVSKESTQGVKEYAAEVKIISQLRHRNLVQLIGWCHQKNVLLLIYEFMPNGSLDTHLFKGKSLLTWASRYNIARGLASALLYLHEEWEQCIVHRDIKSSNVMLDSNFNAKLGDFGLARMVDLGKAQTTTVIAGTMGYLAPESVTQGKASKESDVYSFGVVALEIACGRKPIEPNASEEQVIMVEWVWELYGMGNVLEAADPRLYGHFGEQEMERLLMVGLWCAHPDYTLRPTIREVVHVLSFEAPLPTLPLKMPASSKFSSFSNMHLGFNVSHASSNSS